MLNRIPASLLTFLAAAAIALPGAALRAAPAPKPLAPFRLEPDEYIPVSQIRPGMKGYGLTVFKGVKIEKFAVEVVGVMPQGDMGRPLVLVMLKGGPITERQANLIQGMSGSPIYINGKLLGAFALGESTGREPLGMVRPIEDMVDAFDPRLPDRPLFAAAPDMGSSTAPSLTLPAATPLVRSGDSIFRPVPLPLIAAGASPSTVRSLNAALMPLGVEVMAAPGGSAARYQDIPSYFPKNVALVPGASIAVSLMQGDVDLTAIGVVTYRKGNRILAFGHPFLQLGPAEYPASTAYIHDVFSSIVVSHKYGSPIQTVGTIQQDGPFSVGGLLHHLPAMIPMTVHVTDTNMGRKKDFNIRMVNHPLLLPNLIVSGAQEVVGRIRPFPGESMAKVSFTIVPEGYSPIKRSNTFFSAAEIGTAALQDVSDALYILSRNPFEPVKIKRVDINVELMSGHNTAVVQRAWVEKNKVEPGDTVTVQALIKPYKKATETRTVNVKIPENTATGSAQIVVYGGQTGFGQITASAAPPSGSSVSTSTSTSTVKQLITKYEERPGNNELGVNILLPGSAVSVEGEKLTSLPETLAAVMKSSKASNTRLERDEVKYAEMVPYVLAGAQVLTLTIEKKSPIEKSSSPSSPTITGTTTITTPSVDSSPSTDASPDSEEDDSVEAMAQLGRGLSGVRPFAVALTELAAPPAEAKPDTKAEPSTQDAAKVETAKPADAAATGATATATTTTATTAASPTTDTKEGNGPGRVAKAWKQLGKTQFEAGKLTNATVSSSGDVQLTPKLARVTETTRPFIWSLLPLGDGTALAGTGSGGEILKISADGKSSVFAQTDDVQVHAMTRDAAGSVYAGASPTGRVLKINAAGKAQTFFETGEKYILSMLVDARGNLYVGTGPDGKLFVVSPDGKGRELLRLPEAHVMSLALTRDGHVLAGTSPDGLLYRIAPDGSAKVIFDAAETTITAVAAQGENGIVVATAPSGKVYRILPDGRGEVLLDKAEDSILALAAREDGTVFAAGGKTIYAVASDKTVTTLDNEDQNQIVSLALGADGSLWAGSANTGVVYRSVREGNGTLLSSVHDAGLRARWGRLEYLADIPAGAKVSIQTRSGNVTQPDATWSDWSEAALNGASAPVTSPPARFLQYRASLSAAPSGASPTLHWVSVRYLTDNRPPAVKIAEPKDGERWSGKKTVKWTGNDPDTDVVTYTLYASADNGTTWKALNTPSARPGKSATGSAKPAASEAAKSSTDATAKSSADAAKVTQEAKNNETVKKVESELGKYSDLSPEMRTAIVQTATTALKGGTEEEKKDSSESLSKTTYAWDTSEESDGVYRLKVVASDKSSNPMDALTTEDISGPLVLANAKPTVKVDKEQMKVAADRTVVLSGTTKSPAVAVLKVSYRIDGGDWNAAVPSDGIFDSPDESWKAVSDPLEAGEHAIDVKVTDEVDNTATTTVKVTVP